MMFAYLISLWKIPSLDINAYDYEILNLNCGKAKICKRLLIIEQKRRRDLVSSPPM